MAGVLSALALAAIGCVTPMDSRNGAGPLGTALSASAGADPQQSFVSRELPLRPGDNRLPSSRR